MKKNYSLNPQGYTRHKGIMSFGLPTGVICLIVNFFLIKDPMPLVAAGADLAPTVLITVLICAFIVGPLVKMDLKKGLVPQMPLNKQEHPVYQHFSDNAALQALQFTVICTLIFGLIPAGLLSLIPVMSGNMDMAMSKTVYWIVKSLYSGVFIACSMRWAASCVVSQTQGNTVKA